MPSLQSNGVSLHYEMMGQGPPLCLIMGYRLNSAAWPEAFLEHLARRFTVITFDNRGTGRSGKPADGYSMDNMARDAIGLLDALDVRQAHVLGYSMGGAIAQKLVLAAPEKVDRLILFATFCGGIFGSLAEPWVMHRMRDLDGLSPEEAARQIWTVTYSPDYLRNNSAAAEAQMLREIENPTPPDIAKKQFAGIADYSTFAQLGTIRAPTLIVTGTADILVPPANSRTMHRRIPGSKLVLVPDLAHRAMWEAPDEMADVVTAFLEADSPR